ncbi:MAG: hypothetical protein M3N24_10850 [Actinomycetota bacterium]|nr:hypothetical protein [Actinomycetota bacterium]
MEKVFTAGMRSEELTVRPTRALRSRTRRRFGVPAFANALAGPVLIVASVLVVLNRFLAGRLFPLQVDIRAQWLPYFCFFGRSLREGHLPAWNPHVMGGLPSAADPQMGWLNLPAMALFGALPCDTALRWYLLLQPILAGLGMYWFLRAERLSRPSATVGGLVLSLAIAASGVFGLPWLSGAVAWSAVTLAAASRMFRAEAWSARIGWLVGAALAWGQLAAAHFSHGLVIGTAALLAYAVAKVLTDALSGGSWRRPAGMTVLLLAGLVLVNLAFLVPRLAYLPRTSQNLGYQRLDALSLRLSEGAGNGDAIAGLELNGAWPLTLVLSPGVYAGAAALALSFAAFWAKGRRLLAAGFAVFGAGSYLLTVRPVYDFITSTLGSSKLAGLYMHSPRRFQFGLVLALPVLAALGLEAWRQRRSTWVRLAMIAPGAIVWWALPWLSSAPDKYLTALTMGTIAGAGALVATAVKSLALPLVPLVLAVELAISGASVQDRLLDEMQHRVSPFFPARMSEVNLDHYMRGGRIVRTLQSNPGGRYISLDPKRWRPWGYTGRLDPEDLGLMGGQRAMVFGLEEAQGYNPVQLLRYWTFVRKTDPKTMRYAVSYFREPPSVALDLLDVRWIVASAADDPPVRSARPVAREGAWTLYRLRAPPSRATIVHSWRTVKSPGAALRAVTTPGFRPEAEAIVEEGFGVGGPPKQGRSGMASVSYRQLGTQSARVEVDTPRPAVLVVRNAYDTHWTATIDGRPAQVFPANYLIQGVGVPAGRHIVVLSYDDPWVGYGLLGSAIALLAAGLSALVLGRRFRRGFARLRPKSSSEEGTADPAVASR